MKTELTKLGTIFTISILIFMALSTVALCSIAKSLHTIKDKENVTDELKKIRQNTDDVVESLGLRIAK